MAIILNIDTSSKFCSVCIAIDGEIVFGLESSNEMDHSVTLAPFIKKGMEFLLSNDLKLNSVSVIIGPGSYTGLRIGLSMAKGLCYSMDLPLITLTSLEVIAVRTMFTLPDIQGDEIIIPMLDAGRMEVYTAMYDCGLKTLMEETPMILEDTSFEFIKGTKRVVFAGNGSSKFKDIYGKDNSVWKDQIMPHAKYMVTLSEKKYQIGDFADLAYVTPKYLKTYNATVSKITF